MNARWSTSRVEAFSDGVIAIAITLLVLEINIDPADLDRPWHALAAQWPSYLAFVTSFLTVGGVWLAHHGLFSRLAAVDPVLMRLNLLLLLTISFLPFPTGLMAEALAESDHAERMALVVYGATAVTLELLMAAAARYAASKPELLRPDAEPFAFKEPRRGGIRAGLLTAGVLLGIFALPRIAVFAYFAVAALAVLSPRGELRLTLR